MQDMLLGSHQDIIQPGRRYTVARSVTPPLMIAGTSNGASIGSEGVGWAPEAFTGTEARASMSALDTAWWHWSRSAPDLLRSPGHTLPRLGNHVRQRLYAICGECYLRIPV
jgi:hypothetical protein